VLQSFLYPKLLILSAFFTVDNVHFETPDMIKYFVSLQNDDIFDFNINFNTFHTFGCEWTSDYINFATFDYRVKKSITISNSTVQSNQKVTLRATDFITLENDYTVPLGAEFCAMPTPCHTAITQ
jgi:hypothetical protein